MIKLKELQYKFNDLEPFISEKTMHFHYEKHYTGYVGTTNSLIKGTELDDRSLIEIILTAASDSVYTKLFNNAAQSWNHEFYWASLTAKPQKYQRSHELLKQINEDFGSLDELQNILIDKGINQFASGWVWLVTENGSLKVITTSNADTPIVKNNLIPLLCVDVWEHAYYLDYQNLRKDYITAVVKNLLNWEFADQNFKNKVQ